MTQPQNPGQPYFPQQPSAASAPIPGQPYPPQAQVQPQGESLFGNLFDTSKGFVLKFGNIIFIVAVVGLGVSWLYTAYQAGDNTFDTDNGELYFSFGKAFVRLLMDAPWIVAQILLVRLFIELVVNVTKRSQV